jgi:hypothetical protein
LYCFVFKFLKFEFFKLSPQLKKAQSKIQNPKSY